MKKYYTLALLVSLTSVLGCGAQPRPPGMPKSEAKLNLDLVTEAQKKGLVAEQFACHDQDTESSEDHLKWVIEKTPLVINERSKLEIFKDKVAMSQESWILQVSKDAPFLAIKSGKEQVRCSRAGVENELKQETQYSCSLNGEEKELIHDRDSLGEFQFYVTEGKIFQVRIGQKIEEAESDEAEASDETKVSAPDERLAVEVQFGTKEFEVKSLGQSNESETHLKCVLEDKKEEVENEK